MESVIATEKRPAVSLVIIAFNEETALPKLLDDIRSQTFDHREIEIILVDSISSDGTRAVMDAFVADHDFAGVICKDNQKKILAAGWNVALSCLRGDIVLRLDAHASIPADFIEKNVNCINAGHDICGGKVTNFIADSSRWGSVVNMAEDSMFGGSIASFRHKESAGYVSTLAFAAYRREVFEKVGEFNEALVRTEDNEMHYRMRQAGYKFYYDPDIQSCRETRPTFRKLLKQKYLNGYWVGKTLGVCPGCFSIYHFVPLAFVMAIIITGVLALFGVWQLMALMWAAYFLVNIIMSVTSAVSSKDRSLLCLALPVLFLLLHVGYGLGTMRGIIHIGTDK